MTDDSNETPAGAGGKAMLQYEAEAKALREKTARLRELRLAREAANPSSSSSSGSAASGKRSVAKKTSRKGDAKAQALADWLDTQEKEGRRN